jgi:ABC-2 type transport system permease protein
MNSIIKRTQLLQLFLSHFRELVREPAVLFWGIIFPILMSLGLGIAFTQKGEFVRDIAIITHATSDSLDSKQASLIDTFLKSHAEYVPTTDDEPAYYVIIIDNKKLGNTKFQFREMSWENAIVMLKRGSISIIVDDNDGQINYHFDPLNPDGQLIYLKLSGIMEGNTIRNTNDDEKIKPLTVSGTRYIDFFVPGLIAMGIMMSCMWGISYGIIEKRSQKLLRRMVATPMKKSHFLISLMTVRITLNFVESSLLFLFAWIAFGIRIQGSIAALAALFIAGNIAFAGIAVFISCHTAKTEIGNGLINVVVTPMMVLSGIFFSYHNFPEWAISFIQKFPLTMLADAIRSVFIEGAGFAQTTVPIITLLTIGIVFFSAGLKIFKWH